MWLLPEIFPLPMAINDAFGVLGVLLPGVNLEIAFSGAMLGFMIALAACPPLWVAGVGCSGGLIPP